jgi:predicted phage terminase large subunit-like protein
MSNRLLFAVEDIERELLLRELEEQEAIETELAERSLAEFAKQAWVVMEPGRPLLWGWHFDVICEHLEAAYRGEIRKLLINIPPRFAKSLFACVFFFAWVWLLNPTKRFMYASYSNVFSKRDSIRSRRLIQSAWYQRRWGSRFKLSEDQNEKMRFENDKSGFRLATSVEGSSTGDGGDFTVIDDAHKPAEAYSEASRGAVIDWHKETWSNRVSDEKTAVRIVIGQRLVKGDLPGYLKDVEGGWDPVILPLEATPKKQYVTKIAPLGYDPRKEEGELLHAERVGPEEVKEIKKRSGTLGYAGQYQQDPLSADGNLFKRKWWRFYRPEGKASYGPAPRPDGCVSVEQYPAIVLPRISRYLLSVDANFKEGANNSRVACGVWGQAGADNFLLALKFDHIGFTMTIAWIEELVKAWPLAFEKLIEDKANGPAIIESLKKKISGLIAIEPNGSKEARGAAVSPGVESGNTYLPEGADWLDEYVAEHAAFPLGDFDDLVDMTTQALLRLQSSSSSGLYS